MLAALALGSNLPSRFGDRASTLKEALHRLGDFGDITRVSEFYETDPVGFIDQPTFLNAAALLHTSLGPLDLLHGLLATEQAMGRQRSADLPAKGPRILDLDLLLYEDDEGRSLVLDDPDLILPHPEMHHRHFVLEPLAQIAPGLRHPVLNRSIVQLLQQLNEA